MFFELSIFAFRGFFNQLINQNP